VAAVSESEIWIGEAVARQDRRARITRALLVTTVAVGAMSLYFSFEERGLLLALQRGEEVDPTTADETDRRVAVVGIAQIAMLVVTGIAWLSWLHRAYDNLRLVGSRTTQFTPGWAVGYWLIPIVNLFRPYQIMRELWLRSENGNILSSLTGARAVPIVAWWWGAWLVAGIVGRLLRRMATRAETVEELFRMIHVAILADLLAIASAILAYYVLSRIAASQDAFLRTT
jgi:hypothetical protein